MQVHLSLQGPRSRTEMRSLVRWLRSRKGELSDKGIAFDPGGPAPPDGAMGPAFEVIEFVFNAVAQYGALAVALASWRRAHSPAEGADSKVVLECDGVVVTLSGAEAADPEAVAQKIRELRDLREAEADAPDSRDAPDSEEEPGAPHGEDGTATPGEEEGGGEEGDGREA
ncbi:hypothetical protein O4J56_16235 [Nocardiopsis sp. RSe5-2]|uniref:YbaB/EbfC family DNA-binding protein n=1 Tax=Nocardiopsis endophytica TaxID=3018445 RepID=A0ABT4U6Y0_9ACTN|nr:hypothetical protein [Nocardiopsis endophytica]MDA2812195.1 hypothetical protein [Nocardiopsis endophytica]